MKKLMKNGDFIVFLSMLAFSLFLLSQIVIIKIPESKILPIVALIISLCATFSQLVMCIRKTIPNLSIGSIVVKKQEFVVTLILVITTVLISFLGFYTSLFLGSVAISFVVLKPLSKDKIVKGLLFSSGLLIFSYIAFGLALGIVTPRGLLI